MNGQPPEQRARSVAPDPVEHAPVDLQPQLSQDEDADHPPSSVLPADRNLDPGLPVLELAIAQPVEGVGLHPVPPVPALDYVSARVAGIDGVAALAG